jgi:hypothetical protein
MSDDLLAQMTRALADEHDGATAVPEATRARVVRTLAERRPRRRKWLAIGVPAFLLFGGSTAWAAATGNLPRAVERAIAVITGDAELEAPVDAAPASPQGRGKFAGVIPAEERKAPAEPSEAEEEAEEAGSNGSRFSAKNRESAAGSSAQTNAKASSSMASGKMDWFASRTV